ncbi:leucyl aminopeptidase family protein [Corynebacterium dentalis]|uniref:leucyl aminopeptidase family protein n=1 Tax=Corynebacterium dentalis TaxID=2014528 RepID=UPI0028A23AB1|nr:leucyl aminopeptidase family protein [Corynebacterium dentalis]
MTPIPSIPQPVPTVTYGEPSTRIEGSEVIDVRIVPGARGVELQADGTWEVGVDEEPTQLVDLSDNPEFFEEGWRGAGASLVRRINTIIEGHPVRAKKHVVQISLPATTSAQNLRNLAIGLTVGGHSFVSTNRKRPARVRSIHIVAASALNVDAMNSAVEEGVDMGTATCLSRDLANTPSNVKSPEWLADQAKRAVRDVAGVKVKIRDEQWLESKGFGGVLAVGNGSTRPPRLIQLVWDPEEVGKKRRRNTVLLVGKGVTFDTGGISIKPASGMDTMRTDMTGGASVIAAFKLLAERQVPRKIVALIPAAENMVDGNSYRPGDVVEHYGGITTEVANTDAEGRMILADALSYGCKKFRPSTVVTVATLTGAAKVALGTRTGAVFAPTWSRAVKVARRGAAVGERWWPMPMLDYLEDSVDSQVADVKQAPSGPGAVTAAMFLRRFTRNTPLIHLDIAGPGRAESTFDEVNPVGTGFAARTLVQWLSH